ncbi:NAD-dependent epimerase/dehydratase family protein [Mesorhizobium sp. B3-1-6]|uniref:NAD-dependent epimerase/dehydratase family protein n=1 Tax=Mesorhizobium sp. B3-1-6 TaxID=2589895 RepID=UPI001FF00322|nr:NAD-dependent epimerase/dehydratase family protein [Mesorhizobium sp. B3-1-6]
MSMNSNEVRCLIAGGAGCLGTNLARRLLDQGAQVDVVDNLSTGRQANVDQLSRHPNFGFIKMDIADPAICRRLQRRRYSHVYNLACPTGVPNIKRLGEQMLMASSAGTLNLLKITRRCKAKYLFASTAEAYGDPDVFPQPETYVGRVDPVGPRSPYEEGKRFGEALTRFWGGKYGIEVRIVRIFNTYGPAMSPKDQRVIPQMLTRLIAGQPVPIYGDGTQTRTFLHVDDLVNGLLTVVEKGVSGEVYNVGGDEQITVRDLFATVKKATGLRAKQPFASISSKITAAAGRTRPSFGPSAGGRTSRWKQASARATRTCFARWASSLPARLSAPRTGGTAARRSRAIGCSPPRHEPDGRPQYDLDGSQRVAGHKHRILVHGRAAALHRRTRQQQGRRDPSRHQGRRCRGRHSRA